MLRTLPWSFWENFVTQFWFCIRKVVIIEEVYSKTSSSQWGAWMKQRAEIHRLTELWFNVHLMSTDNFSVGHHGLYSWEKSELYSRLSLLLLLGHRLPLPCKITSTPDDPGKHCRIDPQKLYPCNFPITFFLLKFPCTLLIPRDSHSSTHPLISSYYLCITFISICNNSHSPLFHKFSHKFSAISHVFFFSTQRERTPIQ